MPESLNSIVSFRTTRAERHLFEALAAQQGKLLAHFVREVLLAKARSDLGDWALGEPEADDDSPLSHDRAAMHPP